MKKFVAVFAALLLVAAVAGCAGGTKEQTVFMVTDMGGVDDASFNESAWNGFLRFREEIEGWTAEYIESNSDEDYLPNLTEAVESGSALTWAIGFMMADHLDQVALTYPEHKFAIIDWAQADLRDNVAYVVFKEEEGSFLVGLIAGLMTESNVIGFIGGMEGELIIKFESGFRAGVYAVNPDAEVIVEYAQSWSDTTRGEELASQMVAQGADVIYHAAGGVGIGVAQACVDNNVWFIGVDMDQSGLAPQNTLTSMLKRVDNAVYSISKALVDGEFPGGQVAVLGLAEGGVDYVKSEHLSADVVNIVEGYKQQIIDGTFTVPSTRQAVEEFKGQ